MYSIIAIGEYFVLDCTHWCRVIVIHENTYEVITIKVVHSVIVEIDSGLDNQTLYHLSNELYDCVVILICKGLIKVVYKDDNVVI